MGLTHWRAAHCLQAEALLSAMLHRDPSCRPTANAVASHAVWWGSELRLRFLCELSDRVEHEDREQARGLPEWVHPDTGALRQCPHCFVRF